MAKQKLVENFSKDWKEPLYIKKLPIQEDVDKKIVREGKEYPVLEKWEVPVWRLGKKNLNGRTYHESLGNRMTTVYKEAVTANLADHPAEDGSVKDILSVSKNPHIREGILYVDTYIVDEAFEKKLHKMVEAGFGLGVSSSVLGDVDSDGNVIDESVELDRWFDYVTTPSYEVYVTSESLKQEKVKESVEKENITIINKESKSMSDDKRQQLLEKNTRLNLNKLIEDANTKTVISEKISAYNDVLSYVSDEFLPDVKKSIEEKIVTLQKESLELAEKGKTVDTLNESIQTKEAEKVALTEKITVLESDKKALEEKYIKACELLDEAKEYANKATSLLELTDAECGSRFTATEYLAVLESLEKKTEAFDKATKDLNSLKEKVESLAKANKQLESNLSNKEKEFKKLKEDYDIAVAEPEVEEEPITDYSQPDGDFDYDTFLDVPEDNNEMELDISNDDEVQAYYDDLVEADPNWKQYESVILSKKTLIEAQKTVLRLKDKVSKIEVPTSSLHESTKKVQENVGVDLKNVNRKGWF